MKYALVMALSLPILVLSYPYLCRWTLLGVLLNDRQFPQSFAASEIARLGDSYTHFLANGRFSALFAVNCRSFGEKEAAESQIAISTLSFPDLASMNDWWHSTS